MDAHSALLQSRAGRAIVGVMIAVMAVWIVGPNLPNGPPRSQVDVVWEPAIDAGFDQNWAVFSPNPRDQSLSIDARVEFDDGTAVTWTVPEFDPVVGPLREYRWRKWVERIRLDVNERYWDATAAWIADRYRTDGDDEGPEPIRVYLTRRWIDHAPLTAAGAFDSEPNAFEFHVWEAP